MKLPALISLAVCGVLALPASAQTAALDVADVDVAMRLADLLRAARSVVSARQSEINRLLPIDKGLSGARVLEQALKGYRERHGNGPLEGLSDEVDRALIRSQMQAIRRVVDDNQPVINRPDIAFKGFVPAVFARLVNEQFSSAMGRHAHLKVTAPRQFVRNRRALPDGWEDQALTGRLARPDWPTGKAIVERADKQGRTALRVLVPEYYSSECLSCHGGPAGSMDITGYPKEGRRLGDLSGAISITLFR